MKKICTSFIAVLFAAAVMIPAAASAHDKPVNAGQNQSLGNHMMPQHLHHYQFSGGSTYDGDHSGKGTAKAQSYTKGATDKGKQSAGSKAPSTKKQNNLEEKSDNGQPSQSKQENSKNESQQSLNQFEQKVVKLTNQERTKRGLSKLKVDNELSNMAGVKAQDMIDNNYFDHNSPKYGSPFDMMKQFGISYTTAGENIAAGQTTPQDVVNSWMNSKGHRENILNKNFTHIGVGHVEGGSYGHYWVQEFIQK